MDVVIPANNRGLKVGGGFVNPMNIHIHVSKKVAPGLDFGGIL